MCLEENMNLEDSQLEDLNEEQLQGLIGGSDVSAIAKGDLFPPQAVYGVVIDDWHIPPDNHNPHPQPIPLPHPRPLPRPRPRPYPHPFPRHLP
jgi:hypothetical protein